jgi:hypothetical protein
LPAVEAACAQALSDGVHSSDLILSVLSLAAILARP